MTKQLQNIDSHADYRDAIIKLDGYLRALADAQHLATELDAKRIARDFKPNETGDAIEIADQLLSGNAAPDDLGKRIADTALKITALRRAIEHQRAEVTRIRGEHSHHVCRAAVTEHVALVARIIKAVEELHAANCAERQYREAIEQAGYSSTHLPSLAFLPRGVNYFDTSSPDGGYAPAWLRDAIEYTRTNQTTTDAAEQAGHVAARRTRDAAVKALAKPAEAGILAD